jgi:DNA topoisomerase IB
MCSKVTKLFCRKGTKAQRFLLRTFTKKNRDVKRNSNRIKLFLLVTFAQALRSLRLNLKIKLIISS